MPTVREPHCIVVEEADLWAIQQVLKFNTIMLGLNNRPVFPPETVPQLRQKVNWLVLRCVDEGAGQLLNMPLTYAEAWMLDWAFSAAAYQGGKGLLVGVFRVLWEYEHGRQLNEHAAPADPAFRDGEWRRVYADALAALEEDQEESNGSPPGDSYGS